MKSKKEMAEEYAYKSIGDTVKGSYFHARDGFIAGWDTRQKELDKNVSWFYRSKFQ